MMADVLNSATRRIPLQFDKQGNPYFESVKSPDSFKQRALCVKPPHNVIPVIFVPGIMGTNLRLKDKKQVQAWAPPNGTLEGIGGAWKGARQSPETRQVLFDPNGTEVNLDGPCKISGDQYWVTTEEAKRRGWGALHADSYHSILQQLEISLNDQYSKPGRSPEHGNFLLPEIGLLSHLNNGEQTAPRAPGEPDYAAVAAAAVKAWNTTPPSLSEEEILRLDDYYYPVWAHGYNWLQSNEDSAKSLVEKIDQVIEHYQKTDYFDCEGKVILVTHSMGGLVGRRAAQLTPDKVLGVVHGVQPVAGAPVVYRRFRAGTEVGGFFDIEGAAVAAIIGWNAADITPTLACSPGPLELLPTRHYPPGWLKVAKKGSEEVLFSLPQTDPYEEIYSKTTDDCWWGMLDPALIDPANKLTSEESTPLQEHRNALDRANDFHNTLGLYAHPQTYGYYGIDEKKYRTFGHIHWQTSGDIPNDDVLPLIYQQDNQRSLTGKSTVPLYGEAGSPEVKFKLGNDRDQGGDGTVPQDSAKVLAQLQPAPKVVFRIAGFDHQMSYKDPYAIQATVYGIAKLVQLAAPATPL
jgi:pimeloyl-ACP methyl ester carboxylesterase